MSLGTEFYNFKEPDISEIDEYECNKKNIDKFPELIIIDKNKFSLKVEEAYISKGKEYEDYKEKHK